MRAGSPPHPPWTLEHGLELRTSLRADLERLVRAAQRGGEQSRSALEDAVVTSMLGAGRAIVREPIDHTLLVRNVEAELIGAAHDAPIVVIGARYDAPDPSGVAVELALVRALAHQRLRRPLRFVAFATARGSERYVERLRRDRVTVHAMLSLSRLALTRTRGRASVLFLGDLGSGAIARSAREAFRASSRIGARAFTLPSWLPPLASSDQALFRRQGWPAIAVTDRAPWLSGGHPSADPDLDRMAAAVPGLVAVAVRLAGGRA